VLTSTYLSLLNFTEEVQAVWILTVELGRWKANVIRDQIESLEHFFSVTRRIETFPFPLERH